MMKVIKRAPKKESKSILVGADWDTEMEPPNRGNVGTLDNLPVELLRHIGQEVLELNGVETFIRFARTSKYIHRTIMMDKVFLSSAIESNNKWLSHVFELENENYFRNVFSSKTISLPNERIASILRSDHGYTLRFFSARMKKGTYFPLAEAVSDILDSENIHMSSFDHKRNVSPSVTHVSNLEELALFQRVAEAKKSMGFTIFPPHSRSDFKYERYRRQLNFIAATLVKHPSALLIVDVYGKSLSQFVGDLRSHFYNITNGEGGEGGYTFLNLRTLYRNRNRSCFEFGFRLGGIEVPPLRSRSAKGEEIYLRALC